MALHLKLKDAPNANQCRGLLESLKWLREKRKGRIIYLYMSLFIVSPIGFITAGFSFGNRTTTRLLGDTLSLSLMFLFILLLTFSLLWFIARELQLVQQIFSEPMFKEITPLLHADEKPLMMASGIIASGRVPPWLSTSSPSAYFIFTSDRMLMITVNSLFLTLSQINNHLANGTFEQVVDTIYTVDLLDKDSITFGGINKKRFMFSFSHTQIKLTPVDEAGSLTVILANKLTKGGRLLKIIRDRLENGYSNRF